MELGSPLYRCHARVGYKFFNSAYMVVFDEKMISNIAMNLQWEPNFSNMNSEVQSYDLMSYATNQNTCNVTLIDPFFTGIAFPSLIDTAYQVIGNDRGGYSSMGVLLPPCEPGQIPGKDRCWNYEIFDPAAIAFGTEELRNLLGSDVNMYLPPMLFISLWYETPQGYTFGTDFLFRVSNASVVHGSEYPSVTISGMGNYGVVFQNKLNNMAVDKDVPIEEALEEIANRNGFNLNFCVADYSDKITLKRKAIKANITTRDFLNDIVRSQNGGNMLSPPTKEFFNTLHVCTRADTYQGCNVFYLGKPLYEGYTLTASVDPSWVAKNYSFGDAFSGIPGKGSNVSQYTPEINFLEESSWELIVPPQDPKKTSINNFESLKIDDTNIEIKYKGSDKIWRGEWKNFLDKRDKYFTQINKKFIYFDTDGKKVNKKTAEEANPGRIGRWEDKDTIAIFDGKITHIEKVENSTTLKSITIKTNRVIALRDTEYRPVLLDIYISISNINLNPDIIQNIDVKLGQLLGVADGQNLQTLTFYTSVSGGEKVYLETELALKYSFNRGEVPQPSPSKVPSQASSLPTGSASVGGDLNSTEKLIAEYFAKLGVTQAGIASILGTIKKESSFRPRICNGDFCGLIQWSSARRGVSIWPKFTNDDKTDILNQCRFLILEAKQGYKKTYDILKSSNNLEEVMKIFTEDYARPNAENRRKDSPRFVYAREYFKKLKLVQQSSIKIESEEYISDGHDQAQGTGECTSGASTCYGHKKYNVYTGNLIKIGEDPDNGIIKLHPDAAKKFKEMQEAAIKAGLNLKPISGFRSLSIQKSIWENRRNSSTTDKKRAETVAPPGYSEHHTGYTVDIWEFPSKDDPYKNKLQQSFKDSQMYKWMTENAKDYGFELSFPQGNSQGISFEPWHWRFIGTDEAKAVFANSGANTPTSIQPTPAITKVGFAWPTTGEVGDQTSASRWSSRDDHEGIDINASIGTSIYASAPGTVKDISNTCPTNGGGETCNKPPFQGYGNGIIITHEGGYETLYAHLKKDSLLVKPGDTVQQCQKIAEMGNSGSSTGPHLHFEIRKGGNKIEVGTKDLRGTTVRQCSTNGIIQPNARFPNVPGSNSGNINTNQPGGQSSVAGQSQPGRSGFTIETSFKGVPRALRILPKFTVLSLVSEYSEWFDKGFPDDDNIDPGVWIPDYFRNWLTLSMGYNWTSGDLKCTLRAMSAFGMDNTDLVPSWKEYVQNDMKSKGALSTYKDYIRGFGDLCWTTEDKTLSCHKRCGLTEDFVALLSSPINQDGGPGVSSSSTGCRLDNGKINLSDNDLMALRKISLAEAKGEGKIGMALVIRAIFNRKLIIDAGRPDYCSSGNSIKAIVEAKCSNSSRYQFSPLDSDINTYNSQSSSDFPLADEAIKLAFDYDALKAANISDYILTSNNFRNISTSSQPKGENWIDNGQNYERHTFARDTVQDSVYTIEQHLSAFNEKYGKCERDGNQTSVSNNTAILNCIKISDVEVLAKKISQAESASGGYDAVNIIDQGASTLNVTLGKSYSQLTVQEIKEAQEAKKIGAVGRYQVIRDTMDKAIQGAGISLSDKFDKATQDKIFIWLITIKRPEIGNYLIGANNDLKEAAQGVAREWAGIGLSYPEAPEAQLRASGVTIEPQHKTKRPIDSSLYADVNGNKASVSSASIQESLKAAKANIGDKCKNINIATSNNKNSDIENKLREILNKNSLQSVIVKTKKGIKYEIINPNKPSTVSIASMGKLPIATLLPLMGSKIQSESDLNKEILIDPKLIYEERGGYKEQPSSFAQRTTNGKYYSTVKFLIDKMLRDSNNTATNILIKEILNGPSAATNEAKRLYGNNIQIGYYGPVTRDRMRSNTTVKAETPYIFVAWEKIKSGSGVFYNVVRSALSASNRYKLQGDISSMSKIGITDSILGNVGSYTNGEILVFEFGDNKSYNTSNNQRKLAEIIKEINTLLANQ